MTDHVEVAADMLQILSRLGSGPVFVHSDPFRTAGLVPRTKGRDAFIESHLELLRRAADGRATWMPAFNYDFPRTRTFNVASDPSQLGPIPERFRVTAADWRTPIPIFSASGTAVAPAVEWDNETDPFGSESVFARLVEADGVILYYGDTFHYNTIVHFVERIGGPPYRYDKIFPGTVTFADGTSRAGSLRYHVRPWGMGLEYDWAAILARALDAGACVRSSKYPQLLGARAATLTEFLLTEMRDDPLALLDSHTREWVEPALERLGRRFAIADFETVETAAATALPRDGC